MLLTAQEARAIVGTSISKKRAKELKEIEEAINKAVSEDEYGCVIYYKISIHAEGELQNRGYKINRRDENTIITW